jgi:non-specific serine/threonine protein kinase
VLDLLARLVDKSLVAMHHQGREARYGMLETIREYALEHLSALGEAEDVKRRHSEFFLALAEEAESKFYGTTQAEWLTKLEAEHDNVRAALAWLLEHDAEGCLRLAAAVRRLWIVRGHLREGRRWLEAALERCPVGPQAPARARINALRGNGDLARQQGDLAAARACYEEIVRFATEAGDTLQIALLSNSLGIVALMQGDLRAARAFLDESLACGREIGNDNLLADSLNSLGEIARVEGAWAEARQLYEQAVALWRRGGEQYGLSTTLLNLGAVTYEQGELRAASAYYREALAHSRELAYPVHVSLSLDGLGAVAAKEGALARAARLAGAAEALRDAIGYELERADRAIRERYLAEAHEQLGEAGLEAALAKGRALTLEQALEYALESAETT